MTSRDYSAMAAEVLRRKPTASRPSGLSRDRGIAIVAQAMKESSRARRRQRMWLGGSVAVVTAAAAAVAVVMLQQRAQLANSAKAVSQCASPGPGCSAQPRSLHFAVDIGHSEGRDILPGGVIQADLGYSTRVNFDSGTRLALGSNTMLGYDEGAQVHRFSLSRGSVHLEVAKLKRGQRFLVNTADAEIEVRGTVFDVSVIPASAGCEARTSVAVKEGVVEVRSSEELQTLRPGDTWQEECHKTSTAEEAPSPHAPSTIPSRLAKHSESDARAPASEFPPAVNPAVDNRKLPSVASLPVASGPDVDTARLSDLARQNNIYARASAERNQGHSTEALALYRELTTKFPSSALVESACVQRIRILKKTDPAAAAREAQQYLARYPKGFARVEVESLLDEP